MTLNEVKEQTLQLLARKAQLMDELETVKSLLAQLGAVAQFAQAAANRKAAAESETPSN